MPFARLPAADRAARARPAILFPLSDLCNCRCCSPVLDAMSRFCLVLPCAHFYMCLLHTHTHVFRHTHTYGDTQTCAHIHMCTHSCICLPAGMRTHAHVHTLVHTLTHFPVVGLLSVFPGSCPVAGVGVVTQPGRPETVGGSAVPSALTRVSGPLRPRCHLLHLASSSTVPSSLGPREQTDSWPQGRP